MNPYTQKLIDKIKSVSFFELRKCSLCNCPIGWIYRNGNIFFDSNCDCVTYSSAPQYVEPDSLDFYTDQEGWRKKFGLEEQPPTGKEESVNSHQGLVDALKEAIWQMKRMSQIMERNKISGGLKNTDSPIVRAEEALKGAGVL